MKVKVFVLEILHDGKKTIWPEALPAKSAFAAARALAKDGFKPIVFKFEMTREELLCFNPRRFRV